MIKKSKSKLVKKDGMELVNLVGKIGEHILNRIMPGEMNMKNIRM